jgi:hypothetical protein
MGKRFWEFWEKPFYARVERKLPNGEAGEHILLIWQKKRKRRMVMAEKPIEVAEFVDQTAAVIGLPLQAEHRPAVIDNFSRIVAIAQLVTEFSLPEEVEAAPIFEP